MTRWLDWDGCFNVRDLGGVPLEHGGETRRGVLVRADNVRTLSDAGWASLADHGVTRIVDLRLPAELDADPPREVGLDVVSVSVSGDVDPNFHDRLDEYGGDGATYSSWVYEWLLDNRADRFGQAVAAIADADGAVVFHCAGGKDRTGLVSALILRAVGASVDEVLNDFDLTVESSAWVEAADEPGERARRALLAGKQPEAMRRALEHLDRHHGGAERYLLANGVSDAQLARLRHRLVPA